MGQLVRNRLNGIDIPPIRADELQGYAGTVRRARMFESLTHSVLETAHFQHGPLSDNDYDNLKAEVIQVMSSMGCVVKVDPYEPATEEDAELIEETLAHMRKCESVEEAKSWLRRALVVGRKLYDAREEERGYVDSTSQLMQEQGIRN